MRQHGAGVLSTHDLTAAATYDLAEADQEQAQEVVDLRDGPNRRSRMDRQRPRPHRDRGRQVVDMVGVRLVETFEELPRVSREALQIAPLRLSVEGVEDEAALARAADARDRGDLAQWNLDVDPAKVVHPHAPDGDRTPA